MKTMRGWKVELDSLQCYGHRLMRRPAATTNHPANAELNLEGRVWCLRAPRIANNLGTAPHIAGHVLKFGMSRICAYLAIYPS